MIHRQKIKSEFKKVRLFVGHPMERSSVLNNPILLCRLCYVNGTHGITICKRDGSNLYSRAKLLAGHRHSVLSILYHPTKPLLVSCGVEGVFVWDLDTGSCIQKIEYRSFHFIILVRVLQKMHMKEKLCAWRGCMMVLF